MQKFDWHTAGCPPCILAESPRYAHGVWVWLDITGRKAFRAKKLPIGDTDQIDVVELPDEIACIVPSADPERWVLLGRHGLYDLQRWRNVFAVASPPYNPALHRYNDGRADPQGRIWISSLVDARQPATAALYRLSGDATTAMVTDLIVGNGLAFSPCGKRLMLADTRQRSIWAFEFDVHSGQTGGKTLLHQYTQGTERPDGACFASDGSYWVAVYEGHRLDRFGVDGALLDQIELPVARPTMPCFGGKDLRQLMITCAQPDQQFKNKTGFEQCGVIVSNTNHTGMPEAYALR